MNMQFDLSDFDAVAFDIEGTLANTLPSHVESMRKALAHHGYHSVSEEYILQSPTYGATSNDIHGRLLQLTGNIQETEGYDQHPQVLELTQTKVDFFEKLVAEGFVEQPGATAFVKAILKRFPGKVALVTAAPRNHIYPFIVRYGLDAHIADDLIITHETIHEFGLAPKPSPDPYKLAEKRLQAKRLLVFEDTVPGVTAAKQAGATVIALEFNEQNAKLFRDMLSPPDAIVASYSEVRRLLRLIKEHGLR